jgi:hypothetical protein
MALHLALDHRKALAARIKAAIFFEALPLPYLDEDTERKKNFLLREFRDRSDLTETDHTGPLDHALHSLADHLARQPIEGTGQAIEELRRRRDEVVHELRAVNCQECSKSQLICCGDHMQDDLIVTRAGQCIAVIKELANLVGKWVLAVYRESEVPFEAPLIELSTDSTHPHDKRCLFADFHIVGWSNAKVSGTQRPEIGIQVKEQSFDWESLCQTIYVLSHEFVCHGFQSLGSDPRENADEKCSWTEGWMDGLAFALTRHLLQNEPDELPTYLRVGSDAAEAHCRKYHERRYEPIGTLRPFHLGRRVAARHTFNGV